MIPWASIETLSLDVGGTLISIDFDLVADELGRRGIASDPERILRSEASARPRITALRRERRSRDAARPPSTEAQAAYVSWLAMILADLPEIAALSETDRDELFTDLADVLRVPGQSHLLWRSLMPGVAGALEAIARLGVTLVAVSNSDGTAELGLIEAGIRDRFEAVVDSAVVGIEKPDPRIFTHALELVSAVPERTLHVGDMAFADVDGARAAGLHALLLDPFGDWVDEPVDRLPDMAAVADALVARRST